MHRRFIQPHSRQLVALIGFWVVCMVLLGRTSAQGADPTRPWRLSTRLGLPDWIDVSGVHRLRYETLDGQYRAGRTGGDQMLAFRTTLRADVKHEQLGLTGELIDSSQALADAGTPIDSSMVNTLELLQGYASFRFDGVFTEDGTAELRLGRQTMDFGSRRIIARNAFRNTLNTFTGMHGQWQNAAGPTLRAFFALPVTRLPSDATSLLDNEIQFDEENLDLRLWGAHSRWRDLRFGGVGELYLFGLNESDSPTIPSRHRQLYTPGARWSRAQGTSGWDFDFESVVQLGTVRATTVATDQADLEHFAHFHHAEIGYTVEQTWRPRLAVLFDYASGDTDPNDHRSQRFDTLYGARRFDHGPSGIYGAFARSNIQSPGWSLSAKPVSSVNAEIKHRVYWLASNTDAWTTAGLRDPTGQSGSFIGHQLEASVRWEILPGNLHLDIGAAHLFAGEFVTTARQGHQRGDSSYGYAGLELRF